MPIEVRGRGRVGVESGLRRHQEIESRFRENNPPPGAGGGCYRVLGGVIRIRILMYPACILKDTRILMYPDVSQTYLTCSVTFEENTFILTFCMYCTRIPKESKIHLEYISDTSRYIYLARFLGVTHTLDTYQDTSGYMYLGLLITIHEDTPRYKITIYVSWFLDAGRDTCGIQSEMHTLNVSREVRN